MVFDKLMTFFEENPTVARAIFDKSVSAQVARAAARKAKDVALADASRDQIAAMGWTVEETRQGTIVKKAN